MEKKNNYSSREEEEQRRKQIWVARLDQRREDRNRSGEEKSKQRWKELESPRLEFYVDF